MVARLETFDDNKPQAAAETSESTLKEILNALTERLPAAGKSSNRESTEKPFL